MFKVLVEMFLDVVYKVVEVNKDIVLSYEFKGILYIRLFVIGIEIVMGVRFFNEFLFCIVVILVGNYFKDGFKLIDLIIILYDCVVLNGLGYVKFGVNYVVSLYFKYLVK